MAFESIAHEVVSAHVEGNSFHTAGAWTEKARTFSEDYKPVWILAFLRGQKIGDLRFEGVGVGEKNRSFFQFYKGPY